jgi:hypothetical protein
MIQGRYFYPSTKTKQFYFNGLAMAVKKKPGPEDPANELEPQTWYSGGSLVFRLSIALGMLSVGAAITILLLLASKNPVGGLLCSGVLFLPIVLVVGQFETLTLASSKKGSPVVIARKYRAFIPHEKRVLRLDNYYLTTVDNALVRQREVQEGSILLFIVSGFNLLFLLPLDTGTATGSWVLSLKVDKAGRGEEVLHDRNLAKVKRVAAALKPYLATMRVGNS